MSSPTSTSTAPSSSSTRSSSNVRSRGSVAGGDDAVEIPAEPPDITDLLALMERFMAPSNGPGLPGGYASEKELVDAAKGLPPGRVKPLSDDGWANDPASADSRSNDSNNKNDGDYNVNDNDNDNH